MNVSVSPFRAVGIGRHLLSRRALLGYSLGGAVAWHSPARSGLAAGQTTSDWASNWRPWLLPTADAVRPAPPPLLTEREIAELIDLQARRTATTDALVERWDTGPAVLAWTDLTLDLIKAHRLSPVRAGRGLALLHTAVFDTVMAVTDAQAAYGRPRPSAVDSRIEPLGIAPRSAGAFPSEHAAVAGAAATVLAEIFPDEPAAAFAALADEAATARLWAGTAARSDVDAGLALGRAVGALAVARSVADDIDAVWDEAAQPVGVGIWKPTPPGYVDPPLDPLAGAWQTWVLPSGDALRPPSPPDYDGPAWQAELAAVREATVRRTPDQAVAVQFWAGGPGTVTPAGLWIEIARDLILRDRLSLADAARVLALTSVAMADGFICCWDAKYAYWSARPITADPTLDVLIPTPPFPSYTSGHSTISFAAATVLGDLFPDDEAALAALAEEAKNSRLWAGIHFPIDNDTGELGGRQVGRLVLNASNQASTPAATTLQVKLTKIVETQTPYPGGSGFFTHLRGVLTHGPTIHGENIAFDGGSTSGLEGVFTVVDGQLRIAADSQTAIPGGFGNFTSFANPTISGDRVAFRGFGSDEQDGVYTNVRLAGRARSARGMNVIADGNSPELGVARELSFTTTAPVAAAIPGRDGEFVGDRFVILGENARLKPAAQTRIEMLAADTGPLLILRESTDRPPAPSVRRSNCADDSVCLFDGFPNRALGAATVTADRMEGREVLRVDGIGSSLKDGVAQDVPQSMEMTTELVTPNFSQSKEGTTLVTTQVGIVAGKPDQLFSKMTITNKAEQLHITGDWSPIGTTSYEIQIYNGDRLVTSQTGLASGDLVMLRANECDVAAMRCHIWIIIVGSAVSAVARSVSGTAPSFTFCAMDNSGQIREYVSNGRGQVRLLADEHTPIPGGPGTFSTFDIFSSVSDGNVAFSGRGADGQSGIYLDSDGKLDVVVDTTTPIPGGSGTFGDLEFVPGLTAAFGNFSLDGTDIAFYGYGADGRRGVYTRIDGRLDVVADTTTVLPGGSEILFKTEHFAGPSLSDGNVAFYAVTTNVAGIYTNYGGELSKVVQSGDLLDDKTVYDVLLSARALDGNRLTFWVLFKDGSQAIYLAELER